MPERSFLELVQLHERKWGDTAYPGRPSLTDLMHAQVVAMWRCGGRFMFSVHTDMDSLNEMALAVLTGSRDEITAWKLYKVFVSQQTQPFIVQIARQMSEQTTPFSAQPLPPANPPKPVQQRPVLPGRNAPMLPTRKATILSQIPERVKQHKKRPPQPK